MEQEEVRLDLVIQEAFPDEQLFAYEIKLPWYADIVNYLACKVLPPDLTYHQCKKFLHDVKYYLWDEPLLFKRCSNQIIRRCVLEEEMQVIHHCHSSSYGGHFGVTQTAAKVLQSGFFWPSIFRDSYTLVKTCDWFQRMGNVSRRQELPLKNILEV